MYVISLFEGPTEEAHTILQQLKENGVPVFLLFTKRDLVDPDREKEVIQQMQQLASQYQIELSKNETLF